MRSIIYISKPSPADCDQEALLNDILVESIARNSALDITGVLITTLNFFSGLIEGQEPNVASVMTSILADSRHYEVRTISSKDRSWRGQRWRMVRFDGASFGSLNLDPLLAECHAGSRPDAVVRLERLFDSMVVNKI